MSLPKKHNFSITLIRIKLNSQFNFKDHNNKQYKHDLVFFSSFFPPYIVLIAT